MKKFIIENLNYGTDIVWSCCSMLGEIIDFFFCNFYKIYRKEKKKKERAPFILHQIMRNVFYQPVFCHCGLMICLFSSGPLSEYLNPG